ncbi:MAG: hypothetical protein KJ015_16735 [Myxococcales bacterium]|nr:hypothetical protein [Myxococcales bacterium]
MIQVLMRFFSRRVLQHPPAPLRVSVLMLAILAYGTTGYLYFELPENPSLTWMDGAWYSIVTMTTVGYGDFFPKSLGGRLLVAVPLMFFGIGLLATCFRSQPARWFRPRTRSSMAWQTCPSKVTW